MKTVLFVFLLALSAQKVFANESQCLDQVANYFGIDNLNLTQLSSMEYSQFVYQTKMSCSQDNQATVRLVGGGSCRARELRFIFVCWKFFTEFDCKWDGIFRCYWDE